MIRSMTGYGGAKYVGAETEFSVEIKSVNNRYLDTSIRMPRSYLFCEDAVKGAVSAHITRGKADVFISADLKWMDYLKEKQPTKTQNIRHLVKNELVLIAPKDSSLVASDIQAVDFAKILVNSYLSVGDPAHVPAGKYAKKALEYYGLWQAVEPKLARAKNVRDALSFVERGESPLGIVYSTDAKVSDKVKVIAIFPTESYGEVVYPAVTLSDKSEAKAFLDFLYTPEAKAKFKAAGFYPVN